MSQSIDSHPDPIFTLMNSSTIVLRGAELKGSIHQSKLPTDE